MTTIAVVDEHPAEVFRQLYILDGSFEFQPIPKDKTSSDPPAISSNDTLIEEVVEFPTLEFVPYDAASLSAEHTDDQLQTSLTSDKLDLSLRRIDEQARSSLEEQGVNTLFLTLGMLTYKDSSDSEEYYKAPLVMFPVQLSRKNARSVYTLQAADEDPIVNPALTEHLRRFGVQLPELPELGGISEDYDLQTFFLQVKQVIQKQEGWEVGRDIYLSFFSFQKLLMYKDLEARAASFTDHPIIQQIVLHSGSSVRGLPEEIRNAELDKQFPPENTAQVVNADSSQLRAILAVSQGHSLVIEGPPGTGKSQTITNLVAQALRDDKSVLFVAEKMAALSVVHHRLIEAGLGEFCLELHSSSASKREAMKEIGAAWDASQQMPTAPPGSGARIADLRSELGAYSRDLHTHFSELRLSPYQAFGEFERVRQGPKLKFTQPIRTVSKSSFQIPSAI